MRLLSTDQDQLRTALGILDRVCQRAIQVRMWIGFVQIVENNDRSWSETSEDSANISPGKSGDVTREFGTQGRQRKPLAIPATDSQSKIVQEGRWILIRCVQPIPEGRGIAGLQPGCDEGRLARARRPRDPQQRMTASRVEQLKEPLPCDRFVENGARNLRQACSWHRSSVICARL